MAHLNKDEAIDHLMYTPIDQFRETCYFAYKCHYGVKGHHMSSMSKHELVSWWITLYEWDNQSQSWEPKVPFEKD